MNLKDCEASFYDDSGGRKGVGVLFWCPLCVKAGLPVDDRAMLPIAFKNPLDGGPAPEPESWIKSDGTRQTRCQWQRSGDTIETLVLSPSIDASGTQHKHGPGWHGHVQGSVDGRVQGGEVVGGGV